MKTHLLEPRATEKTYAESFKRTYVFPVAKSATKQSIAAQVAKEFNVTVVDVRVLTRKGKQTKFSKGKHAYPGITFRQNHKYAYVTLKDGDSIKVFATEEEVKPTEKASAKEAKKEEKAEKPAKSTKKADKEAGKENK